VICVYASARVEILYLSMCLSVCCCALREGMREMQRARGGGEREIKREKENVCVNVFT